MALNMYDQDKTYLILLDEKKTELTVISQKSKHSIRHM